MTIEETNLRTRDHQIGGDHYAKLEVQPMDVMYKLSELSVSMAPAAYHIIPYVMRYKDKGGIVDLEKAKDWCDIHHARTAEASFPLANELLVEMQHALVSMVLEDLLARLPENVVQIVLACVAWDYEKVKVYVESMMEDYANDAN